MIIKIAEKFGPICVESDAGAELCAIASQALSEDEEVHLDFTGVTTLATQFLNRALGCLYGSFTVAYVEAKLSWNGLDAMDSQLVELVRQHAIRYYAATPDQQERIVEATNRLAGQRG